MTLNEFKDCIAVARIGLKAVAADDRHTPGVIAAVASAIANCEKHAAEWQERDKAAIANAEHSAP
jgi:hypothetical protein